MKQKKEIVKEMLEIINEDLEIEGFVDGWLATLERKGYFEPSSKQIGFEIYKELVEKYNKYSNFDKLDLDKALSAIEHYQDYCAFLEEELRVRNKGRLPWED